ncbi:hypothetical protein BKA70DRAFT_1221507 [Coprinopsis sp. MPI-PUGE-AT-0042]|nr:hypothetical protein BKA70DRAFT_1221507 [Coprinopsis sp. MPI-PUGE-AT-0042]
MKNDERPETSRQGKDVHTTYGRQDVDRIDLMDCRHKGLEIEGTKAKSSRRWTQRSANGTLFWTIALANLERPDDQMGLLFVQACDKRRELAVASSQCSGYDYQLELGLQDARLHDGKNPSPTSRLYRAEKQPKTDNAGEYADRSKQNPSRTPLGDVSQPNIPKASTPNKLQFQAPTTAVITTKPPSTSNRRNARSPTSAAVLSSADFQPQNTATQSLPKHLVSSGEDASLLFPGRNCKPGCSTHNRFSVEDGSSLYFGSFHSFIANRVSCKECGLPFSHDLDHALQGNKDFESDAIVHSLHGHTALDHAKELALRVEFGRLYMHVARLQVQYAMGVFVDRLRSLELSEISAHPVIHEKPDIRGIYKEMSPKVREGLYADVQGSLGKLAAGDFALITTFGVDLKNIESEASFSHMEHLATQRWDNGAFLSQPLSAGA